MPEGQEYIYYAAGETLARAKSLPQVEAVKAKGYELLYFTDNVDEFAIRMLMQYRDKKFKSVADSDLNLESEEEKKALEEKSENSKAMLESVKKALEGKVSNVKLSSRLKNHAVCLSSEGEITMEMAKTLNAMPGADQKINAQVVLEINPEHNVYDKLMALSGNDEDKLKKYSELMYYQALLIEGMPIENPSEFAELICELM